MADFLGGLLGGGGGLYDDLLTPQQQSQLSGRGLLAMAGAFADAAMPSRLPIPLGAAIGKAAAAMGTGRDQAALQVLQAQKLAQEVQTQKITAALQQKMMDEVSKMSLPELMRLHGAGATSATPVAATPAAPAAPPQGTYVPTPAAAAPGAGRNAPLGTVSDLADAGAAADSAANAMPPPNPSIFGAPGAEALPDFPIKTGGLLGPPDQMLGQPPPGQGLLPRIAAMQQGGGANGWPPFGGNGELPVRLASGGWPFPAIKDAPASIGPPTGYKPDSGPGFPTNPTDRDTSAIPPPNAPNAFAAILGGGPDTASTNADVVLPPASGPRGVSASMLQRVADKGGAPGAPTPPVPPGVDPQAMNALLLALAKRNAMAEILKLGNPYSSMLSVLQGSPEYKGQIAGAEEGAKQPFALERQRTQSELDTARDLIGKGVARMPDGSMVPIPNAAAAFAAIDNAKQTTDIKEYQAYAGQEKALGGIPKSFEKWDLQRRQAMATSINTAEGLDAAQMKARIAVDQKVATDAADKALASQQLMPLLDEALRLARTTPGGLAGPVSQRFAQVASAFGITVPSGASNAEALGSINQQLIPLVRQPGAQSNMEMDAYLRAGPGLMLSQDGRVKIAEMTKAMSQRAIEVARVYRENIGAPDLYAKLATLDKPLFTAEQRAAMEAATNAAPAAAPATGAPAAPGAPRERRWNPATNRLE